MGIIRLRERERVKLRDGVLIQGLPGIGLVGKIAVDYIVTELKLRKIAELYSDGLLLPVGNAGVFIDLRGVIRVPSYNFYIYNGEERDIVFLSSEIQPVSWSQYEVAEKVLDYFQSIGGREVVAVCGTTIGEEAKKEVYYAAANEQVGKWLEELGFKRSTGGTITGACGLLPGLAALRGLRAYVLMGTTRQAEPDPEAGREIVMAISKIYGIRISLENLEKLIEDIKRRQEEARRLMEVVKEAERRPPEYYV